VLPGRLAGRIRGLAADAGVVSYRRPFAVTPEAWDRAYANGELDFYADVDELPRYMLLFGYLRALGGRCALLDVGCGIGLLRSRLDGLPFSRYVGVDLSSAAIGRAARLADERTTFLVGELPPAELGRFDVAVLSELLYYADDPGALLDRVAARLVSGGHVLTSIWRHPGDRALQALLDDRFERVAAAELRSRTRRGRRWRVSWHQLRAGAP